MIWLRGPSEVSIVDIGDFSARHIHNFWNFKGSFSKATTVAMDADANKLVGLGFLEYPNEIQTVHVFDGGDGVSIFEAREIDSNVKAWICLEVSIEGDVFFIGGAQNRDFSFGDAYIFALNFDENADTITFKRYGEEFGFHCVNSLRRHPDGNILFAGCQNYLVVILWAENNFLIVTKIKNVCSNPITDICFSHNAVFSVCDHSQGMACYFDDNLIAGRSKARSSRITGAIMPVRKSIRPQYTNAFEDYSVKQINLPGGKYPDA